MWLDAYASKYQEKNGFRIKLKISEIEEVQGFLSLKPSTRSTYDIAMRDATIDGLITMEQIEELKPGRIFYKEDHPHELFILQSANSFEFQKNTMNINAIKQNCFITVQRRNDEDDIYKNIYTDIISFVTMQNKEEKNFGAGTEDNTFLTIQIPKRNISNELYRIIEDDRLLLNNLYGDLQREVKVESINSYAIPGIIMISGTFDTRI